MHKQTLYQVLIVAVIAVGAYLNYSWHYVPPKQPRIYKMVIQDALETIVIKSPEDFYFEKSDYNIVKPVSDSIRTAVQKLSGYFDNNPDKNINIVGQYHPTEINNSALPNLGLARATAVKNYMIQMGVSPQKINVLGEKILDLQDKEGFYSGPLDYKIVQEIDKTKEYAKLKKRILADPLVVYFGSGESSINLDTVQRQKVVDILTYLDKMPEASCRIIGHTDNLGNAKINYNLGLDRAAIIKDYLVKNGLSADKVSVESKGPDAPIAENTTNEGRAKNRRTEITFNEQ